MNASTIAAGASAIAAIAALGIAVFAAKGTWSQAMAAMAQAEQAMVANRSAVLLPHLVSATELVAEIENHHGYTVTPMPKPFLVPLRPFGDGPEPPSQAERARRLGMVFEVLGEQALTEVLGDLVQSLLRSPRPDGELQRKLEGCTHELRKASRTIAPAARMLSEHR